MPSEPLRPAASAASADALAVLHADADWVVVNKPAGLLVHRTRLDAHEGDNALDRLRHQWPAQFGTPAPSALAPAHRLDKGTSGLLVFTRHASAARALGQAFELGQVRKRYITLVRGWPPPRFSIDHPLARDPERPSAGQPLLPAVTHFERLACVSWPFQTDGRHPDSRYAWVQAWPQTGRRHQIRRHLKHAAHPIVGDATHGKGIHNRTVAQWLGHSRLWLHAIELELPGVARPGAGTGPAAPALHLLAPLGPEWLAQRQHGPWQDDGTSLWQRLSFAGPDADGLLPGPPIPTAGHGPQCEPFGGG